MAIYDKCKRLDGLSSHKKPAIPLEADFFSGSLMGFGVQKGTDVHRVKLQGKSSVLVPCL